MTYAHGVEQFFCASTFGLRAGSCESHGKHDVIKCAEVGEEVPADRFPDETHNGSAVGETIRVGHREKIPSRNMSDTGGWGIEASEDIHQGGLSRTRGANDGDHFAGLNLKRETLERPYFGVFNPVGADKVGAHDEGLDIAFLYGSGGFYRHRSPLTVRAIFPR